MISFERGESEIFGMEDLGPPRDYDLSSSIRFLTISTKSSMQEVFMDLCGSPSSERSSWPGDVE